MDLMCNFVQLNFFLHHIQAYKRYNGSPNDPVGKLEVGVPLIHLSLEPTKWFTVTQKVLVKSSVYLL